MQQRNKNVTQEVERVAMGGKAGAVNEVYVKKIFAMYIQCQGNMIRCQG